MTGAYDTQNEIQEGQKLIIVEATKLEFLIAAPYAGKVFDVMAALSEVKQQGGVLLTLDQTADANSRAQRKEERG